MYITIKLDYIHLKIPKNIPTNDSNIAYPNNINEKYSIFILLCVCFTMTAI